MHVDDRVPTTSVRDRRGTLPAASPAASLHALEVCRVRFRINVIESLKGAATGAATANDHDPSHPSGAPSRARPTAEQYGLSTPPGQPQVAGPVHTVGAIG